MKEIERKTKGHEYYDECWQCIRQISEGLLQLLKGTCRPLVDDDETNDIIILQLVSLYSHELWYTITFIAFVLVNSLVFRRRISICQHFR